MVKKDFVGICKLADLPNGMYFKFVKSSGDLSKEVYTKDYYERSEKKYQVSKHSDILGNGRLVSGKKLVSTDFIY